MMKGLLLVVLVSFCSLTLAQKYIITRQKSNQPDLVQISSSLCYDNGTTECPQLDGKKHSMCRCACNMEINHNFYRSTFGFHNGRWKCQNNTAILRHSGCSLSLDGAGESDSITFERNAAINHTHSLSNVTTGDYIKLAVGKTCSLRAENSTYMKCNGEWEQLNTTLVTKRFNIIDGEPNEGQHFVRILVNPTERFSYPLPSGRVIRLAITCSDRAWESSQCIVAKVQGELECPVTLAPTSSISATSHLSTALPTLVAQPSTTLSSTPQLSSVTLSTTSVQPTTPPPSTTQISTVPFSPTSTKTSTTTKRIVDNPNGGSSSVFTNTMIGAALGGVTVLVVFVIIIILIAKRRNNRPVDQRKNSRSPMVIENESFEQEEDTGNDSNHNYANINPLFVPSPTASAPSIHVKRHPNLQGHRDSVTNKVYEVVEELNQPDSTPVNNAIKEKQDATGRIRKKPIYTVPESTLYTSIQDPHKLNGNINDGPESYYEPVYDVLDGPDPNGALHQEDPSSQSTFSDKQNHRGRPGEALYDSVGDVIRK